MRDHAAAPIVDAGREIPRLAHHRAEGGMQNGLRLLLDHGDEPVPHHLPANGVEGRHRLLSITMCPDASTKASKFAGTTVEVCSSAMTAGPPIRAPAGSPDLG